MREREATTKKRNYKKVSVRFLLSFFIYLFLFNTLPFIQQPAVSQDFLDATRNSQIESVGTDRVALIESEADALNVRLALIRESQVSIDIAYHTIRDGRSSDTLLAELYAAAERGVSVRLLLDAKAGFTSHNIIRKLRALNDHSNIVVKRYNPIHLMKPWEFQTLLHDKFLIADDKFMLLGGRNIGDRYFDPDSYSDPIAHDRDILVWNSVSSVSGSVLGQINEYMDALWDGRNSEPIRERSNPGLVHDLLLTATTFRNENPDFFIKNMADYKNETIQAKNVYLIHNPIHNRQKEPWVGYQLRELGEAAEKSVTIQTPYSTANQLLLESLESIAQDKQLTVLTNSPGTTPNLPAFSNYYSQRDQFIATGATFYEYQGDNSIHAKSFVFDNRVSAVGSFNLDDRSLYLSTETMVVVEGEEFAEQLSAAIENLIGQSLKLDEDNTYVEHSSVKEQEPSYIKKAGLRLMSIFSRLFQFLI